MTKHTEVYDAEGNPITGALMPDGGRVFVKMTMMDAAPDIAAITRAAMADAGVGALHKPGTLLADGVQAQIAATAREVRRDLRLDQLSDAWRNPPAQEAVVDNKAAPQIDLEAFHDKRNARLADAWKGAA
jgi:hypothetical protein